LDNQDLYRLNQWSKSELVLIGGSAGSFQIISELLKRLPATVHSCWIIIMHRGKSYIDIEKVFTGHFNTVKEIADKDRIQPGVIYIAPADYHVLLESDGGISLDVSEHVHYSRPSIDVTFESAAEVYGDKCAAILLSGANEDGAKGLSKLRKAGSLTICQSPTDAEIPIMPQAAINYNAAEFILTKKKILETLTQLI
jgi:two-component system chemotaxis response regulator CheB